MRDPRPAIWQWARKGIPEGQILPKWLQYVYATLYPLQAFYWRMSDRIGYRWHDDTWAIHGVRWSSPSLRHLSKKNGALLRVVAVDGELITIETVNP